MPASQDTERWSIQGIQGHRDCVTTSTALSFRNKPVLEYLNMFRLLKEIAEQQSSVKRPNQENEAIIKNNMISRLA